MRVPIHGTAYASAKSLGEDAKETSIFDGTSQQGFIGDAAARLELHYRQRSQTDQSRLGHDGSMKRNATSKGPLQTADAAGVTAAPLH